MPIKLICDHCRARFAVPDQWAGKKGRCPKCGGVIRVPEVDDLPVLDTAPAAVQPSRPVPQPLGGDPAQSAWTTDLPDPMTSLPPPSWQSPAPAPRPALNPAYVGIGKSLAKKMLSHWLTTLMVLVVSWMTMVLLFRGRFIVAPILAGVGFWLAWVCLLSVRQQREVFRVDYYEDFTGRAIGVLLSVLAFGGAMAKAIGEGSGPPPKGAFLVLVIMFLLTVITVLLALFWLTSKFGRVVGHGTTAAGVFLVCGWLVVSFTSGDAREPLMSGNPTDLFPVADVPHVAFPGPPDFANAAPGVKEAFVDLGVPSGQPGEADKLYVYLPEGDHAPRTLPCVFIAPAGGRPVCGRQLGSGDNPEHLPYVEAGFAVVAYEIDGDLNVANDVTEVPIPLLQHAYKKFSASMGGMVNARNALEYALANVPEIDPAQLFAAGHSSAGTAALLFAAHEPRLKGCIAYAPATDYTPLTVGADGLFLELHLPGVKDFLTCGSPITHAARIRCPLFLFHTKEDEAVEHASTERFIAKFTANQVTFVSSHGDHYYPMLDEGIPKAIAWLEARTKIPATVDKEDRAPPGRDRNPRRFEEVMRPQDDETRFAPPAAVDHDARVRTWEERSKQLIEESDRRHDELLRHARRQIEDAMPKPDDPKRFELLAELMMNDNARGKAAIDQLLAADPATAPSEARNLIARNFRTLAEKFGYVPRSKTIRGLATWSGKQSMPILLGMLEQRRADRDILDFLAEHPDPVAATAVAKLLNDQLARHCLRRMGPVAEDAVIGRVPSEDERVYLAAVELLGDIGTEKSLKVLRKAVFESRNPQVKAAAKTAVRRITERQDGAESGAP
jgi:dienelactone hydrolase